MAALVPLTYRDAGIDYGSLDDFKRMALEGSLKTQNNPQRLGVTVVPWSLGESCALYENGDHYLGFTTESLGTKSLVTTAMEKIAGRNYHGWASQDTIAMVANDMITIGVLPVSIGMLLVLEDGDWLKDTERARNLIQGWYETCNLVGCAWGGGETPALKIILAPGQWLLAGAGFGKTLGPKVLNPANIRKGDVIILLESSGIHANGLSLARLIADKHLPHGYATAVPGSDKNYGQELLTPTHIYVRAIEACLRAGLRISYAVNITGHGWAKLMRARQNFRYVIDVVPPVPPVFDLIQEYGNITLKEMHKTFNRGAGFGIYIHPDDVDAFYALAKREQWPFRAFLSGHIEEGEKQVIIDPLNIRFGREDLAIR